MVTEKTHIVIVTSEFPPQPGGIGNHAYHLALYLANAGFSVEVIADQRSVNGEEELEFDASLPFSIRRIKRYNFRFRMYLNRIISTLKSFKKGSVIIATGKFSLWNVAFSSMFSHNKTIAVVHGSEVNFKSAILRGSVNKALKRMHHIIAVSNYTKSLMGEIGLNAHVIPNGIDIAQWEMKDIDAIEIKGAPVVTTVGRVSSRKGQLNVIKKLPYVIETFPNIHYHCIGIPTEAEQFKDEARRLGVMEHVTFHGSVNDETLKQLLKVTDIFVMLSSESTTGDVEGFGIAILEANALGVPAIGSKDCGIEDAIQDYHSGILVDAADKTAFVKAIATILDQKGDYKKASRSWAENHSWDQIVEAYINVINS